MAVAVTALATVVVTLPDGPEVVRLSLSPIARARAQRNSADDVQDL